MAVSHSDKALRFFAYIIALYGICICLKTILLYFPAPESFKLPVILEIATNILHIVTHVSVIAVVYYLGRKKLFWFLCLQITLTLLIPISVMLASKPIHFQMILVINFLLGLLYIGTFFFIRKIPFVNVFRCLAVSEAIFLLTLYTTMLFFPSQSRIINLLGLIPVTALFVLVQKARLHLAKYELEAKFLEDFPGEHR